MSRYRRSQTPGGCYFFTVVSYQRHPVLCNDELRQALRDAIRYVQRSRPFIINAWVLLPDHLHCIWTLPPGDNDFSQRWSIIKRRVSIACRHHIKPDWINASKAKHRESTLWQRRFWEHRIRDDEDFSRHMDYIHYNPVKHGLCEQVKDWPYSTFHRYVESDVYPMEWGGNDVEIEAGE